jgi:hypothetical protein
MPGEEPAELPAVINHGSAPTIDDPHPWTSLSEEQKAVFARPLGG